MHPYVQPHGGHRPFPTVAGLVTSALCKPWSGSHHAVLTDTALCRYLLFFDGGSRGNPGPGGAGAVVARLAMDGGPFQLVWAGSMSYAARSTTNNVAENLGLLAGLTACKQFGFSPIHVVGDSAMIIRQQATRTPPKAPHLRPIYWRCRRQLGGTQVLTWQHHFRAQNKMADSLANLAMDTQKSIQVRLDADLLRQPRWGTLVGHAGGDIGHWVLHNMDMDSKGAAEGTL